MKIEFEIDKYKGIVINGHIRPAFLKVVLTTAAGMTSLPLLVHIGQALGWM